jgi:hypothetical protein
MRIAHWRGPSQARCANELEFQGARDLSESRKVARGDKKKRVWTSKFTTSPKRGSGGARECRFLSLFPVTRVFTGSKSQFDDQSRARVP